MVVGELDDSFSHWCVVGVWIYQYFAGFDHLYLYTPMSFFCC